MKPIYKAIKAAVVATKIGMLTVAMSMGAAYAEEPIRIGSVLSITGPASFLGEPELKTLQLYVNKLNGQGGILGRKIELIHYDDGSDANKANGFTKRLIDSDKVDVLIGGTTTGATMSSVPLVEKAGIPLISLAGGVVVIEPTKKWVFKTPGSDRHSVARVLDDMKKRGFTKIAVMSETSGVGQSSKAEVEKLVGQYGISIVLSESFGSKDTDVTPQLTRIRTAPGVQAVAVFGFGQGPVVVTKNFDQLGMKLPLYHTHGVASQEFLNLTGKSGEGVRLSSPALLVVDEISANDPQKAVLASFRNEYKKAYKEDPATFGGYAYDALMIVAEAIKKSGGTNKEKVRDALESTKGYVGTAGIVNMSPTDHMGLDFDSFRLIEIKQGSFKFIR